VVKNPVGGHKGEGEERGVWVPAFSRKGEEGPLPARSRGEVCSSERR